MVGLLLTLFSLVPIAAQNQPAATDKTFSSFLVAGDRRYVKMRDVYLGPQAIRPLWSRDGKTLLVEIDNGRSTVRDRRRSVQKTGEIRVTESALLRYSVETGDRDVIYRLQEGETVEDQIFVGPGADVLFSVARVDDAGKLTRFLYFAPADGPTRQVDSSLDVRIPPSLAASPDRALALMAVTTPDKRLQVFEIGPGTIRPIEIPGEWQYGTFVVSNTPGAARIVVHSLDEKDRSKSATFGIDFATGVASEISTETLQKEVETARPVKSKMVFRSEVYRLARTVRDPMPDEASYPSELNTQPLASLREMDLLDEAPRPHRLCLIRGFTLYAERSPDGLKAVYSTGEGAFLAELVAVTTKPAGAR